MKKILAIATVIVMIAAMCIISNAENTVAVNLGFDAKNSTDVEMVDGKMVVTTTSSADPWVSIPVDIDTSVYKYFTVFFTADKEIGSNNTYVKTTNYIGAGDGGDWEPNGMSGMADSAEHSVEYDIDAAFPTFSNTKITGIRLTACGEEGGKFTIIAVVFSDHQGATIPQTEDPGQTGETAEYTFSDAAPTFDSAAIIDVPSDLDKVSGYNGTIGTDLHNLSSGGNGYCPKGNTCVWYDFTAPADGTFTFVINYLARTGANRGVDWALDDPDGTARHFIDLEESGDARYVCGTFEAKAGQHSFYVYAPTNMDDSTLKSCDVFNVAIYQTATAQPDTPDTPDTPDEPVNPNPGTGDASVIAFAAVACVALASVVVFRKKER